MLKPPYIISSDGPPRMGKSLAPSEWTLDLASRDLTCIRIDHEVHLQFDDIEVSIGTPFELRRGEACHILDPEGRGDLGPLLALYPTELATSDVDADGTLRMSFNCGASISVSPHSA